MNYIYCHFTIITDILFFALINNLNFIAGLTQNLTKFFVWLIFRHGVHYSSDEHRYTNLYTMKRYKNEIGNKTSTKKCNENEIKNEITKIKLNLNELSDGTATRYSFYFGIVYRFTFTFHRFDII